MVVRFPALAAEGRAQRRQERAALRLVAEMEWLTAEEVAAELGCHVNTIHRLRKEGRIEARPHGTRVYRFSRAAVEAFKAGQVPAASAPAGDLESRVAALEAQMKRLGLAFTEGA